MADSENPFPRGIDTSGLDHDFHIARARAIERYAGVEQSMALLFAALLNTHPELAGVVFFRITSSGYRNKIIASLLEKRLQNTYDTFWHGSGKKDGLFHMVRQLDDGRNKIVHWHTSMNVTDGKATHFSLRPPNFWHKGVNIPVLITSQLDDFSLRAEFVAGAISAFTTSVTDPSGFPTQAIAEAFAQIL
jgi:hypothetical protein